MVAELQEPSRPQNAYWLWLGESREALAKEVGGGNVSAVGKLAGERWKAMAATQKQPYEAKAAGLKAAYERAMEDFKAKGGQPGKRRQEKKEEKQARATKKARKEARKASGQPPKPRNAYWLFLAENRDAFTKQAGTGKAAAVGKLAGEKWKALPAAQKKPFEVKAAELRTAYEKELEEWKKNGGGGVGNDDGEDGEEEEEEDNEDGP